MQIAIFSDVHSNLAALEAVLGEIDRRAIESVYCVGDTVGYGPDPVPCLEHVRSRCRANVLGNHDLAVATGEGIGVIPRDAQEAALHNRTQLSDAQRAYLAGLPLVVEADGFTFAHASPQNPDRWHRLDSFNLVRQQFDHFATDVCFIGHSHVPAVMSDKLGVMRVRPGNRYLINVGSVGQPRDGDPRAAFVVFDLEAFAFELVRVPYDIERTRARIAEERLPERLGRRLSEGR